MSNITINEIEYEMINTVANDMSSTNILKTIVEEGETSVNTYRLNLPPYNPETLAPFLNTDQIIEFCNRSLNIWSVYFDDPVEEDGGE
tara:strand:+ start:526 stop:789 length:264 start_codon:yes stop_codon:yes gene_type:complete